MTDNKELYQNRAEIDRTQPPATDYTATECCHEELAFALKDKYHEFSLGLSTVLECLAIAEKEGYVPKLPDSWWLKIRQY